MRVSLFSLASLLFAAGVAHAARVEGYLEARDRTFQLDYMRRLAQGRLSEIFAKAIPFGLVDQDIAFRHIGPGRIAAIRRAAR